MTVDGPVPFTPEEEAEWDAMERQWAEVGFPTKIREQRDALLKATDWTQGADVPQSFKDKWALYRQALRDVPQQAGFPDNVTWPTKPE
jgi:hypothetical protein